MFKHSIKPKKSCINCIRGTSMNVNNDILCREEGAVSPDYVCKKHKFMPQSKSFKDNDFKCIQCENFVVSDMNPLANSTIGLCKLFSVRQFDGERKRACSKFLKSTKLEVS
ncbi:MAG: hypothetical protein N2645_17680 [Clostridia bacterium]|nr:hypothetical protein [Clostridia bacterium]